MFFVHNNGAKVRERQQDGGAGADQNNRFPPMSDSQPGSQAFAVVQGRMPGHNPVAEVTPEALEGLGGREVDFGNQYQSLLVVPQFLCQVMKIELGLAAPGDAIKKCGTEAICNLW